MVARLHGGEEEPYRFDVVEADVVILTSRVFLYSSGVKHGADALLARSGCPLVPQRFGIWPQRPCPLRIRDIG